MRGDPTAHYCARAIIVYREPMPMEIPPRTDFRSIIHRTPTVRAAFGIAQSMAIREDVELAVIEKRANQYAEWEQVATVGEFQEFATRAQAIAAIDRLKREQEQEQEREE